MTEFEQNLNREDMDNFVENDKVGEVMRFFEK